MCRMLRVLLGFSLAVTAVGAVEAPRNFAIVVDTSGSMIGLYQRRDPQPTVVTDLIQRLIRETMVKGDRLAILQFDHQLHDGPQDVLA